MALKSLNSVFENLCCLSEKSAHRQAIRQALKHLPLNVERCVAADAERPTASGDAFNGEPAQRLPDSLAKWQCTRDAQCCMLGALPACEYTCQCAKQMDKCKWRKVRDKCNKLVTVNLNLFVQRASCSKKKKKKCVSMEIRGVLCAPDTARVSSYARVC